MYTIVKLITLFSIPVLKSVSMQKASYFSDKNGPEDEIADFIYSKGYLPKENELPKPTIIKNDDNDVTYLLSKLSDNELIKLLNDQPKKKSYDLNDIVKITLGGNSAKDRKLSVLQQNIQDEVDLLKSNTVDKRFRITPGNEINQQAFYKLNHLPIVPNEQKNKLNYLALKKLQGLLNYRHEQDDLTEDKRELLFDILVSQLKTLCCKSGKEKLLNNLQIPSNIVSNAPRENLFIPDVKTSNIDKKEFMFLIVNDEIKSQSNGDLVFVDPETLEKNSSVLLLGPLTTPLTDGQLKVLMDRISNELSKPEYTSFLQQLSDGTLSSDNINLMKNLIFGHETRRYIKPHRCNYQSKLAKVYGGPRWLICTGYLNINTPSLYD